MNRGFRHIAPIRFEYAEWTEFFKNPLTIEIRAMPQSAPPVSGIILAAGQSKRMGRVKQLLPFRGKPLIFHIVCTALASRLEEVIVVLGHGAEEIGRSVDFGDAQVVMNHDYQAGQSTSLQTGISAISDRSEAALFILGDQPLLNTGVINRLIEEFEQERIGILVPTFHGKRGNPVLVGRSFFPHVESLTGDQGARALFQEYADQVKDIDVGDDYLKLTSEHIL
jgi:molybdenum cofactor cytidylyltransferase